MQFGCQFVCFLLLLRLLIDCKFVSYLCVILIVNGAPILIWICVHAFVNWLSMPSWIVCRIICQMFWIRAWVVCQIVCQHFVDLSLTDLPMTKPIDNQLTHELKQLTFNLHHNWEPNWQTVSSQIAINSQCIHQTKNKPIENLLTHRLQTINHPLMKQLTES